MYRYELSILIAAPIDRVFRFHDDTRNLLLITAPGTRFEILEERGGAGVGREVLLRMWQFGLFRSTILMEFIEHDPPFRLSDIQRRGPFPYWLQRRLFRRVDAGTMLTDIVEYEMPFGLLGRIVHRLLVRRRIDAMFRYRQKRTRELLEAEG